MNVEIKMSLEKETKGTWRYLEDGDVDKHILHTMYVRKTAFQDGEIPQRLVVRIEGN